MKAPDMREKAGRARAFRTPSAFRAWLARHGATAEELFVRCVKVEHRGEGVTYRDALDEALCVGWIDGVRHALDDRSFSVRFTPRRAGSRWSRVNVARAKALIAERRMQPAGAAAFARRRTSGYSFESRPAPLSPQMKAALEANARAWQFFRAQPPSYRRVASFWVMSAKRDETREKRFGVLLSCSARGVRIPLLQRPERTGRMGQGVSSREDS